MLIQGNCVKEITASGGGDLVAPAGQSIQIRKIEVIESTNDTYLTLKVDRVTVGFYRLQGLSGNHIDSYRAGQLKFNMFEFLKSRGINVEIPIAEGQTFTVSRYAETGHVIIVFDRYDAGDIRADMPNGSAASEYTFLQYMNIATGRATSGDALFDEALSPAEFPDFPCGKSVPANHRITMLGLVGSPWIDGQSGPKGFTTTHIKLIREREVLFDEDRNGLPFKFTDYEGSGNFYAAEGSLIGAGRNDIGGSYDPSGVPLIFDPSLVFEAGVELNIYAVVVAYGTTPTWTDGRADLAAILKVERI